MIYISKEKCRVNAERHDSYFKKIIESGITQCISIAVARKNEIVYNFTGGTAFEAGKKGKQLTSEVRLVVGSVAKTLTGTLIIKLIESGALTMSDPVKKFIPHYKYEDITIFHLLTHSAGYPEHCDAEKPTSLVEKEDFLKRVYDLQPTSYKPGEDCVYFSQGYCILSDIIEKITGKSLEQFAQETIFKPLEMTHTTYEVAALSEEEYILPWSHEKESFMTELCTAPAQGDGDLLSTSEDLLKFGSLFLNNGRYEKLQVISTAAIDIMLQQFKAGGKYFRTPIFFAKGEKDAYTCFGDLNSSSTVGHTGYTGCMLLIDPVYETTAVILTNSTLFHEDWSNYKRICNVIMSMT